MPPTAIISDIHANATALRAVLADVDARGVERVICLGDIVGYGAEPLDCVDLVAERCDWSLLGNHDFSVLYEPTNFNANAAAAAYWTREQFDSVEDGDLRAKRLQFLGRLRVRVLEALGDNGRSLLAVHGSPRRPINEYVFSDDVINCPDKLESIFSMVDDVVICGHTHVPGVFTSSLRFHPPEEAGAGSSYLLDSGEKAIVNVGSVGQPRDLDPRASYAVLHDDRIAFHRVEYDIDEAAEKIRAVPELDNWLAQRLYEGR